MDDMASDGTKTKATKTLSDGDISTYARRGGPAAGGAGTDADAHAHTDADAVATDHDTLAPAATDADAQAHTDKD
ncbi:hypothetical protein [Gymnodinialimonas hymeniacidonis]|uniref:hypothetical protein n=1 Tax=Gymnodinialimonas hymeniacidonis TaxID=3126508 RepID=UPI0034C67DFF